MYSFNAGLPTPGYMSSECAGNPLESRDECTAYIPSPARNLPLPLSR